jgi:tungstate transport system ATP-binding protein
LIETTDLTQKYDGKTVLNNVNIKLSKNDVFAIIGPTGSGKTTLMRLLDLLEAPYSGNIYYDGIDVSRLKHKQLEIRRKMAYVHQKPVVFTMSVYENIACGLEWRHRKSKEIKQKVDDILELVAMTEYRNRNAKTLSGGETQRIAIARALVTEPEVLLLDEPTANMDPISTNKIEEVLKNIIQEHKTTIVMNTHQMSQGQRLANKIGVLMQGELMQIGSPDEIFYQPKCAEVAEFVGYENVLPGVITGKENELVTIKANGLILQGISQFPVGSNVNVLIRPDDIIFTNYLQTSSARNTFKCTVRRVSILGPIARIEIDCGFSMMGVLTSRSVRELNIEVGSSVYASFKATAIHIVSKNY